MVNIGLISFLNNSINTRLLSAYLKERGYDVTCFFCSAEFNDGNLSGLAEMLVQKQIGLLGVSLVTDDYRSAVIVTGKAKQACGIPVIWGGAHVNVCPDECLKHADMICMGEGEEALLDVADQLSQHGNVQTSIPNVWFRNQEGTARNEIRHIEEDLDKYPFPDFDFETQYVMTAHGFDKLQEAHFRGEYSIMTSRGCPYRCKYCYNNYRWEQYKGKGRYLRMRSIENVIDELSAVVTKFKSIRRINIWDDSFSARNIEDFRKFKALYSEKINLPFFALIEPMAFNNDKIKLLRECGLAKLQIGIQTGSETVNRNIYNRSVTNQKVKEMADFCKGLGIEIIYDVIFNNPYETRHDVQETLDLLLSFKGPFAVQGFNLIFYPGTEITDNALKDGHISRKGEQEDFSTIQGSRNTPIFEGGKAKVSDRFYKINYLSDDKQYLNSVIALFAFRRIPHSVIRFFARAETSSGKIMIRLLMKGYVALYKIKNALSK